MNEGDSISITLDDILSEELDIIEIMALLGDSIPEDWEARTDNLYRITEYDYEEMEDNGLFGNGNGMQYFGAILVKSEQPFEELLNYYESYNDDNWHFIVEKQLKKDIQIIEHGNLSFQTNIKSNDYYIVYSWGKGNSLFSDLDIRGH